MRPRDPLVALEDVLAAGSPISQFLAGHSLADYQADPVIPDRLVFAAAHEKLPDLLDRVRGILGEEPAQ